MIDKLTIKANPKGYRDVTIQMNLTKNKKLDWLTTR